MKMIISRLQEHFPFIGSRPATEDDLYLYCERRGVAVRHTLEIRDGLYVYFPFDGSEHIFLNSRLSGFDLMHVFAHEIGHQMFHVPSRQLGVEHFDRSLCRRNHAEAEAVAALLLITPETLTQAINEGHHRKPDRRGELVLLRYQIFYEVERS